MAAKARRMLRQIGSNQVKWDPPSVSAGGGMQTWSVAVPGAKPGDAVVVTPDAPTAGVIFGGYVSGVSTVTLTATNVSGSAVNPMSTSFAVLVFRP